MTEEFVAPCSPRADTTPEPASTAAPRGPRHLQPVPPPWPADDPRTTRRWVVTARPADKTQPQHTETVTGDHRLDVAYARLERDPAYAAVAARPA